MPTHGGYHLEVIFLILRCIEHGFAAFPIYRAILNYFNKVLSSFK